MILPALLVALIAAPVTADTLASRVTAARSAGRSTWLAWQAPSKLDGVACCWSRRESRQSGACSLASESYGMNTSREEGSPKDATLLVYAHVTAGGVDRIRVFSGSCEVDRAGESVQDLASVPPSESVNFLGGLLGGGDSGRESKRRQDSALMAIALHDDPSADGVLERAARENSEKQIRKTAAFWLGNTREQAGYDALVRLRTSEDVDFRQHLTFAFSQSKAKGAPTTLIDMARNDPSPKVRGQALFWIAQKAQKKSDADVIRTAVDDPDTDVKKQAVFALSQIPKGEGVPDLIRVARENRNREVRKQAMFWLGQSKDPRALAFFEDVLSR